MRTKECAEEYGVMWPTKVCIEVGIKLHKAISANEPFTRGAYRAPYLWYNASTVKVEPKCFHVEKGYEKKTK